MGRKQVKPLGPSPVFKPESRDVPDRARLFLYVRAGGRCEFDGCNRYLLEHHLTGTEGIFAQMAHIWAFSEGGPRGQAAGSGTPHELANLMLLCPQCHKLVDDDPEVYPVTVLRVHKKAHEDRVFILTELKPDRRTVGLVLVARVGGRAVRVSDAEMQEAVAPNYLGKRDVVKIDLTELPDAPEDHFWQTAADAIRARTKALYDGSFEDGPATNVSVFALAPIPLLVHLGTCVSDKVLSRIYQRHRDTENWKWKESGDAVRFATQLRRSGSNTHSVALVLSISGRIGDGDLPATVDESFTVYEIAPVGVDPSTGILGREESLRAFAEEYRSAIRDIVRTHAGLERVHLFPATPAPVAVAVGRELLPKRDPALVVYDYDKRAGGFIQALEVNTL